MLEKFPHISNDLNNFEKYDPACDAIKKTYSLIQFVINSIISVVLIFTVSNQSYLVTFGIAVMLVFSTSLVNLILENKQWAINLEIVRALFVMTVYLLFAHKTSILTVEWFFYQAVFSFIYLAIFLPINKKSTYSSAE